MGCWLPNSSLHGSWADAWCTSGGRAACAFLTAVGSCSYTKQTISGLQEKDLCCQPLFQCFNSIFLPPYGAFGIFFLFGIFFCLGFFCLGFFSLCSLEHWFSAPVCKGWSGWNIPVGEASLAAQADPHVWSHLHPVQEELRAEVQGGGRGRAVLWTHQRCRQPEANRKGTWDASAGLGENGALPSPGTREHNNQSILQDTRGFALKLTPKNPLGRG